MEAPGFPIAPRTTSAPCETASLEVSSGVSQRIQNYLKKKSTFSISEIKPHISLILRNASIVCNFVNFLIFCKKSRTEGLYSSLL